MVQVYTVFKGTDQEFTGNITEIARNFKINYGILYDKVKSGCTFEETINWYNNKYNRQLLSA